MRFWPCHPLVILSVFAITARADYSQIQAIEDAQKVNKTGSDDSLQASTTSAMKALMELANQNRASAIKNGYDAFGKYRNSGDLDSLRLKNSLSALKMDSIGGYLSSLSSSNKKSIFMAPVSDFDTSYGRLDPKFLQQGEAGKVAEQFEKATGMKRETFLKKMAAASESSISTSDPHLVDKVLGRFESFVKEIPNAEFREKVEKEIASVPQTARTGIISQGVQKFTQLFANGDGTGGPVKTDVTAAQSDQAMRLLASVADAKTEAATPPAAETAETVAAALSSGQTDQQAAMSGIASTSPALVGRAEYRGIDFEKFGGDAVGNTLQMAVDQQKSDDTIFKQISRKYKALTAALVKRAL